MDPLRQALFAYHHRAVHLPRVERVASALGDLVERAESILDVGCGDGTIAEKVGARVGASRVAGVDVLVRPEVAIEVTAYDGERLPFEDGAFEAVLLADVLHHCERPGAVLKEALRVASRVVAVKDHFQFGPVSDRLLWLMDVVGNAAPGVRVRGTYFAPADWISLVDEADGRATKLVWPLRIHDLPFRLVTRSELQFAARVEHAPRGEG